MPAINQYVRKLEETIILFVGEGSPIVAEWNTDTAVAERHAHTAAAENRAERQTKRVSMEHGVYS